MSASCYIAEDTFQEKRRLTFKSKKYQAILNACDTDEYGTSESINTICKTLSLSGVDPIMILHSHWENYATGAVKDKEKREIQWSKIKNEEL